MKVLCTFVLASCLGLVTTFAKAQSDSAYSLQKLAQAIVDSESDSDAKEIVYRSLIFEFARQGKLGVFQALADRNPSWDLKNENGSTLLHVAAANGHAKLATFLLDNGLQIDVLNASDRSALFEATVEGHTEIAKLLLERGADVNGNSKTSQPLNAAAWYGHYELIDLLLSRGADHTRQDADGNTPLHKAVWQGNIVCVTRLIKAGADRNAQNNAGQTPMGMAMERTAQAVNKSDARPWGIEQLLGPPDAGDAYTNLEWCPSTDSGTNEWVDVLFDEPVDTTKLEIYAKPTPASVNRVTAFDEAGTEFTLWEGNELKAAKGRSAHIAEINLRVNRKISRVKVYLSSAKVNGWVYYDAIGLKDNDGEMHWATWADSSTCYARGPTPKSLAYRRILKALQSQ